MTNESDAKFDAKQTNRNRPWCCAFHNCVVCYTADLISTGETMVISHIYLLIGRLRRSDVTRTRHCLLSFRSFLSRQKRASSDSSAFVQYDELDNRALPRRVLCLTRPRAANPRNRAYRSGRSACYRLRKARMGHLGSLTGQSILESLYPAERFEGCSQARSSRWPRTFD